MTLSKTIETKLVPLFCATILLLTIVAAAHSPSEHQETVGTEPPIITVDNDDVSLANQLRHAYSRMNLEQFPTGILLDQGSMLFTDSVQEHNGDPRESSIGLSSTEFIEAYGDLVRSSISAPLPSYEHLKATAQEIREQQHITPLCFAVISYDFIGPEAYQDGRVTFDGEYFHGPADGQPFYKTKTFYGIASLSPTIYEPEPTFILPSTLLISQRTSPLRLDELCITFNNNDCPLGIRVDQPFTVSNLKPDKEGHVQFCVSGLANGNAFSSSGTLMYTPLFIPLHYDLNPITASLPYNGAYGKVNVRIYPSQGSVVGSSGNYQPKLKNVMFIVDGFDVTNSRTQETIWVDFGSGMQQFIDMGFDLISIDYTSGNDYIQRNGLAIREVLKKIPGWMAPGFETRQAVVVAGSMGTQTSRYALRTAELAGEDHHVGLFIALDGPFKGANIPIGLQAGVMFLASESAAAQDLLNGLNSPASSQMLLKNRYIIDYLPPLNYPIYTWYTPNPLFSSYYNEVNGLGLPTHCRNVAVASGSGIGQRLHSWYCVEFAYLDEVNFLGFGVRFKAYSDRNDVVFDGHIRSSPFWKKEMKLTINSGAQYVDLAPGGTRNSAQELVDTWNANAPSGYGGMTCQLGYHNFIPTFSALAIDLSAINNNYNYAPAFDSTLYSKTPFDAVYFEPGDSVSHVQETADNIRFIKNELRNFTTRPIAVGDFNGDGHDDIILQSRYSGDSTYLLCGLAGNGFASPVDITTSYSMSSGQWADEYRIMHTGDFNGDGHPDLLLQNRLPQWHSSYLLLSQGAGGFTKIVIDNLFGMSRSLWADDYRILHTGDFNGDGKTDVLLQSRPAQGHASYLLYGTNFGFTNALAITNLYWMYDALWSDYYRILHTGDFNGDGKTDVLLQNRLPQWHNSYL
ncbi:MAG: VCBS repeat-containing protein, partial [Candidatus Thermoplasmatota archaeon]|nr:VCBS repeat-containing protein [Candidatus Thermoplasmatota archaeon]